MKGTSRQALCAALHRGATESEEGTSHHPLREQSAKKEEAARPLCLCFQRGGTTACKEDAALCKQLLKREGADYPLHPLRGGDNSAQGVHVASPSARTIRQEGGGCASSVHSVRGDNSARGGHVASPYARAIGQEGGGCLSSVHSARGDNSAQGGNVMLPSVQAIHQE
jgi:hypothetical protein